LCSYQRFTGTQSEYVAVYGKMILPVAWKQSRMELGLRVSFGFARPYDLDCGRTSRWS